jgi:hypothetical protein
MFLCCKYEPAGNIHGSYKDNVVYARNLSNAHIENCLRSYSVHVDEKTPLLKNPDHNPTYSQFVVVDKTQGNESVKGQLNITVPVAKNDSSFLLDAIRNELDQVLQDTDKMIYCTITISFGCMILLLIVLTVNTVGLVKISGLNSENECCSSDNSTPCNEMPHFNKNRASSASVQSYM